jgi:hypothetical protein
VRAELDERAALAAPIRAVLLCRVPLAPKPLFRDPIHDGAADPVVVWDRGARAWRLFYTNRRANVPDLPGVAWVHGGRIGHALSLDGGGSWHYRGTLDLPLPPELGGDDATHWAPDVVATANGYVMLLTVVPGVFSDWNHPRHLVRFDSPDLRHWQFRGRLALPSDRVIDAAVERRREGCWRLWYNDENDGKSIHAADSTDLVHWTPRGRIVGDPPGEGPKAFCWRGWNWLMVDVWDGLAVYRSPDGERWTRQPENLLHAPGTGLDDGVKGNHADVVVGAGRAYVFYFTHPGRRGPNAAADGYDQRRSSLQVAELQECNGWLVCDRDAPVDLRLEPPAKEPAAGADGVGQGPGGAVPRRRF